MADSDEEEGEGGSSSALLHKRTETKEEKVGALGSSDIFLSKNPEEEDGAEFCSLAAEEEKMPILLVSYLPENCHLFG